MNGASPLLSLYALMARTGNTLPFYLTLACLFQLHKPQKKLMWAEHRNFESESYVYWTVHHCDS